MPTDWDALTVDDRAYVESYICARTVFYYRVYEAAEEDILN